MSGFGDKLRREREMRGVSLEEIAESTKIGTRSLRALEDEDFEKLPGGIFNRGFVRAYSRFLGLDEEQTVTDFDSAWKEYQAAKAPAPELQIPVDANEEKSGPSWLLIGALLLVIAAAAGWLWVKRQKAENVSSASATASSTPSQPQGNAPSQAVPSSSPTVAPAPSSAPAASASAVSEPTNSTKSEVSQPGPKTSLATAQKPQLEGGKADASPTSAAIHLEVFAREASWLSVSADGKNLGQGILAAQKSRTIRAQREVHLRVGNVTAVEVSFNGKAINIDGEPRQAKDLIFTPDGLRQ